MAAPAAGMIPLRADYGVAPGPAAALMFRLANGAPRTVEPARRVVHRTRGQLCGQPRLRGPWRQHRRSLDWIAELLSRIKLFVFKYLHRRCAALRPVSPRQPSIGAAVELSARAGHGFADE